MATWIPKFEMNLTFDEIRVPIELRGDGAVRVDGSRLSLASVLYAFADGASPEDVVMMFPGTDPGDAYLIFGYYLKRKEEAEEYLRNCDKEWERAEAEINAQSGQKEIRQRIRSRARKMGLTR